MENTTTEEEVGTESPIITGEDTPASAPSADPVVVTTKKKRSSKSWYVKLKDAQGNEREERITGVTSGEAAIAATVVPEGDTVLGVRPVRAFK